MNWFATLQNAFKWMPYIVAGVETIHAGESTETKTQMAQQALGIATAGAQQNLSPEDQQIANSVSAAINAGIAATQVALQATNKASAPNLPSASHADGPQG